METGPKVTALEVLEDFSATARCDEGFLQIRRLRCQNRHADGGTSAVYRVDVVDRPRLDAVSVLVYRRSENGELEVLTRTNLRPAAYFRKDRAKTFDDEPTYLQLEEIVAGLLEPTDQGEAGVRARAVEEVREEAGFEVTPDEIQLLGGGFFVAPGIVSEKIFPTCVEVTGKPHQLPRGDGSPLEEGASLRWRRIDELLALCRSGEIPDAKTEISITRLLLRSR